MRKYCDLHTHSYFSDGTLSPRELVERAEAIGLSHIALCDHNTTAGLGEFLAAAEGKAVAAIPAVELSCDWKDGEVHLIGMFLPKESYPEIEAAVADMQRRKDQSNRELIERLRAAGINIGYTEILGRTKGHINRAHVAEALVLGGYARDIKDAFSLYLKPHGRYYIPPRRLDLLETVALIKRLGAVAVLAHPFVSLDGESEVRELLEGAVPKGLDAVEAMYSTYDTDTEALALSLVKEYGILASGGSDYHGKRKPDIDLGVGRGALAVPRELALALKARAKQP